MNGIGLMSDDQQTFKLFQPGRLCLFGEHSDWAAEYGHHPGYCLVVGTDHGLRAEARQNPNRLRVFASVPGGDGQLSIDLPWVDPDAMTAAAKDQDEFFRYVVGTALSVKRLCGKIAGIDLFIDQDLPLGKGVSSSAAACVLTVRAFDELYNLGLLPFEVRKIAYQGERLTGSQCGRMDQACIYGRTPVLLSFGSGSSMDVEPVSVPEPIYMFFVDLGGQKDTRKILADLRQAHHYGSSTVREYLGPVNEQMVRDAYWALTHGDAEALGRFMIDAQQVFDRLVAPASPQELASPLLHQLLDWPGIREHIHGGKGVGSQGDGTAQFVVRSSWHRDRAMSLIEDLRPGMKCYPLTIGG